MEKIIRGGKIQGNGEKEKGQKVNLKKKKINIAKKGKGGDKKKLAGITGWDLRGGGRGRKKRAGKKNLWKGCRGGQCTSREETGGTNREKKQKKKIAPKSI